MTTKTQAERTSAKALSRFVAVAAVLLTLCLVFMMPVGAVGEISWIEVNSFDGFLILSLPPQIIFPTVLMP